MFYLEYNKVKKDKVSLRYIKISRILQCNRD